MQVSKKINIKNWNNEECQGGGALEKLKEHSTKELHDELIKRGGVESYFLDPYKKIELVLENEKVQIEGPATILIVTD